MKKAIVTILMSACAIVALVGCSGNDEVKLDESQIILGEYKGIEVTDMGVVEVTDEDVDVEISTTLQYMAEAVEVKDRPVQLGDTINYDYAGTVDGVAFDGGTAEDQTLMIGSGRMIPGFEDGIIGMEKGETKEVPVTFPEEYKPEGEAGSELNGADAIFTITVDSITEHVVPELTDELVESLSDTSTTIEEYRTEVRTGLEEYYVQAREDAMRNEAWNTILENTEVVELPQEEVDKICVELRTQYEEEAAANGYEFAEFLQLSLGMTEEQFEEAALTEAETNVEEQIIIDLIAGAEGISPTEEQENTIYDEIIANTIFETVDELKETVDAEILEDIILQEVVMDWVVANATIIDME